MNHIKRIAHGDMEALGILHEAYKTPVYRLAFSMTGSRVLAEDITQDTFLRIQEKAGTYRHNTRLPETFCSIQKTLKPDIGLTTGLLTMSYKSPRRKPMFWRAAFCWEICRVS